MIWNRSGRVGIRRVALVLAVVAASAETARLRTDPAVNLARVRVIVTGTSATTDVTVSGATLASYTSAVLQAPPDSGASQTGPTLRMTNGTAGRTAEAQFDAILSGVQSGTAVVWNVAADAAGHTSLEIFSLTDVARPQLVDRFTVDGAAGQLRTDGARLASAGALDVTPLAPNLVLAVYYPWYTLDSWKDPQFIDQPQQPYSSDDQTAVNRQASEARAAGIDAFAVSWQGRGNADNDRRMRLVLDAARRAGMHAAVFVETYIVNPSGSPTEPVDPDTLVRWLEDAVDLYAAHPAYLRANDRPVIFVYIASLLSETQWRSALAAVRATGRNPILIGDFFHSRLLNVFDGEFQYTNVTLSPADLLTDYRTETLRVRTFDLLSGAGSRRIWTAAVSPGYDDRRLTGRSTHTFVDRADGAVYDAQWRTALSMAPDWVMISTWNEYFENSGIEASARFGTRYLDATKRWTAEFKGSGRLRR